jgi:hypothetical protein
LRNEPDVDRHDEESLNTILKLNFKNTKQFKIEGQSRLDGVASSKLYNNTHELEVKVDFLERELYGTEQRLERRVQYYCGQLQEMLGFMDDYGLVPKHYDIDRAETFASTRSMLAALGRTRHTMTSSESFILIRKDTGNLDSTGRVSKVSK